MEYLLFAALFVIIPLPAILGVYSVRLWRGTLEKNPEFINPVGIAIISGFAVVIGAAALAAISTWEEFGHYAVVMFAIGHVVGWIDGRND